MAKKQKTEKDRAPLCKICQTHHWSREPHNFKKESKNVRPIK